MLISRAWMILWLTRSLVIISFSTHFPSSSFLIIVIAGTFTYYYNWNKLPEDQRCAPWMRHFLNAGSKHFSFNVPLTQLSDNMTIFYILFYMFHIFFYTCSLIMLLCGFFCLLTCVICFDMQFMPHVSCVFYVFYLFFCAALWSSVVVFKVLYT